MKNPRIEHCGRPYSLFFEFFEERTEPNQRCCSCDEIRHTLPNNYMTYISIFSCATGPSPNLANIYFGPMCQTCLTIFRHLNFVDECYKIGSAKISYEDLKSISMFLGDSIEEEK